MRDNLSLDSPAGRHAVRLAVIVVGTALLAQHVPLQRSYWMVVAAATALRPEFGATFTRGAERIAGTCAGVALAGLIAVTLHPSLDATIVIIACSPSPPTPCFRRASRSDSRSSPRSWCSCSTSSARAHWRPRPTGSSTRCSGGRSGCWPTWCGRPGHASRLARRSPMSSKRSAATWPPCSGEHRRAGDSTKRDAAPGPRRPPRADQRRGGGGPVAVRAGHAPDRP